MRVVDAGRLPLSETIEPLMRPPDPRVIWSPAMSSPPLTTIGIDATSAGMPPAFGPTTSSV